MTEFNITIEGPGGVGKTTLAKMISKRKFDSETQRTENIEQRVLKAEIKEDPFFLAKNEEERENAPKVDVFMHVEDKGGQVPFWKQYSEDFKPDATNETKPNLVCLGYDMSEFLDSENKFSNTSLKKIVRGDAEQECLPWILLAGKDANVKVSTNVQKMPLLLVGLKADMIGENIFRKMKKFKEQESELAENFPLAYHGGEGIEAMMALLAYKTANDAYERFKLEDLAVRQIIKERMMIKSKDFDARTEGGDATIHYLTKKEFNYMGADEETIRKWEYENGIIRDFAERVENTAFKEMEGIEEMVKNRVPHSKMLIDERKQGLRELKEQSETLQAYLAQRTSAVILARTARDELGLNVIGIAETSSALGLTHEVERIIAEQIRNGNYKR